MPRRNLPRGRPAAEPPLGGGVGWARAEDWAGEPWLVRTVPAAQAVKYYRCPGCDHEVRPGTAHVVVWPAGDAGTAQDRRHWHSGCWSGRERRAPTRRR